MLESVNKTSPIRFIQTNHKTYYIELPSRKREKRREERKKTHIYDHHNHPIPKNGRNGTEKGKTQLTKKTNNCFPTKRNDRMTKRKRNGHETNWKYIYMCMCVQQWNEKNK